MLIETIRKKITDENLIPRRGHVVVGFSGGPDSTCLFDILSELRHELGYTLSAAHINHGLRGAEADGDQRYVERLCEARRVPLLVRTYDIARIARQNGKSAEEAGRDARYETFAEAVRNAASTRRASTSMIRVALAHNKGDLSETVLMRIIRGTGPDGLAGILADRSDESGYRIIRPLIGSTRAEIEAHCSQRGLDPRRDSTNDKTDYLRNSIRLELLPMLRDKYNPSVDDALARLSHAAAESRDYIGAVIDGAIADHCEFEWDGFAVARFPLDALARAHPAIRHRLIVGIFEKIGLTQDIGAAHIAAADDLIEGGHTGKRSDFPGGYTFGISYENATFTAPRPVSPPATNAPDSRDGGPIYAVSIADIEKAGGSVDIFEDSRTPFEAVVKDHTGAIYSGASLVLDYEALSSSAKTLRLRTKATGDKIRLPGMNGSKKLQDIFVDEKIPREKRSLLPVITADEEVLWIPGVRRTRLYEPTPNTSRVLVLTPLARSAG
jgi:tRNA(Ile)-lysidine synthase